MCTARPIMRGFQEDEVYGGPLPIECLTSGSTYNIDQVKGVTEKNILPQERFDNPNNTTYYDPSWKIVKMPTRKK